MTHQFHTSADLVLTRIVWIGPRIDLDSTDKRETSAPDNYRTPVIHLPVRYADVYLSIYVHIAILILNRFDLL